MSARIAKWMVAGVCAALAAVPTVHAEPGDPYLAAAEATDGVFIDAINRLGLGNLNNPPAVAVAHDACGYIRDGHTIRDTVDGVRNTYGGMAVLPAAHFVAVARAVYCPDTRHIDERGGDTAA
ncbi:DUF732 domain-containing protein [Mycobacterium sp. M1]|uniref:DUF732 domain-containing protein n=1 Tax=Mycolicibacter acidiphilus TaxID=2835306 RepID=A0ABS5RFR8_9MYCO|nr:DUF732 domain-containing protein [Mycolicibacter acidiphilus]MBS9532433.1 DUF732 domain-containing protein [Mycolicibacter acidiphilus]